MEKFWVYRNNSLEWKPSAVVALATSADGSRVAAARDDGSMEIWLVSPGSVGWHCQLTIQGDPKSRVSSLLWFHPSSRSSGPGRLISSSLDGSVTEWDIFSLQQKVIVDYVGASIWQMAAEPLNNSLQNPKTNGPVTVNGSADVFSDSSSESSDSDEESDESHREIKPVENRRLALACDDGCVRLYCSSDSDDFSYHRSFPRVGGRMLSVIWSLDGKLLFSGSSEGFIRCWDASQAHEVYRITAGHGLCIWSLLFLRCGTLVSGDSGGNVQFWDSRLGTFLLAHSHHKGDVNALEASPSHNRVFSAGSDGQVIMYKLFTEASVSSKDDSSSAEMISKWVYARYVRVHTHDVRALTVASPICSEDVPPEKKARIRQKRKPVDFAYSKWAHAGVPMLISGGDDSKMFAYSVREFSKFSPHDVCPTPQRPPIKLAVNSGMDGAPLILAQYSTWLDVSLIQLSGGAAVSGKEFGRSAGMVPLARVKCKGGKTIVSSGISGSGVLFAYSDETKPSLFELRRNKSGNSGSSVSKRKLPPGLPSALCITFTADSSRLILSGHDRKIYMIHVEKMELMHVFVPRRVDDIYDTAKHRHHHEPPVTRLLTSADGQWLAAVSCFGDIYIFNLEINKQHWFIARLNGASVTAGGFSPSNSNILVVTTSSNHVFAFDVEAKQLGEWSKSHSHVLPRRFQEFPGEVMGLSFTPSLSSTSVIIYSSRAMCLVDFGMPVVVDLANGSAPPRPSARGKMKRKPEEEGVDFGAKAAPALREARNFVLSAFKNPVLFVGHLSEHSIFLVEKSWIHVARSFDAPVHRHVFGT